MLEQFKSAIATKVMPALDRNSLVDDLFALVSVRLYLDWPSLLP